MFSRCNVSKKNSVVFHIVNFLNNCNYNENDCFFSNNNNYIQHVATRGATMQTPDQCAKSSHKVSKKETR